VRKGTFIMEIMQVFTSAGLCPYLSSYSLCFIFFFRGRNFAIATSKKILKATAWWLSKNTYTNNWLSIIYSYPNRYRHSFCASRNYFQHIILIKKMMTKSITKNGEKEIFWEKFTLDRI